MATTTTTLDILLKARADLAAFKKAQTAATDLRKTFGSINTSLASAGARLGVGIFGAGSLLELAKNEIRHVIANIESIPGVPPQTVASINQAKTLFTESRSELDKFIATGIAGFADFGTAIGYTLGAVAYGWDNVGDAIAAVADETERAAAEQKRLAAESARLAALAKAHAEAQAFVVRHIAESEREIAALRKESLDINERAAKLGEAQRDFALEQLLPQERLIVLQRDLNQLLKESETLGGGTDNATFERRVKLEERILEIRKEIARLDTGLDTALDGFFLNLDEASRTTTLYKEKIAETSALAREMGYDFRYAFESAAFAGKKLSEVLKQLGRDILASVLRDKIINPVSKQAGDFLGGIFDSIFGKFGGAAAMGGPVSGGMTYLVGERGPELFVPSMSGSIVPNHELMSAGKAAGADEIHIHNHFEPGVSHAELANILPQIVDASKSAVLDARRRRQPGFA